VTPAALAAFDTQLERCAPEWDLQRFLTAYTATARSLGRTPLHAEAAAIPTESGPVPLTDFTSDVAGRALLLCRLADDAPARLEASVTAAYREGDTTEKVAVVRALALLPQAARFIDLALDAGRHNELGLFRALACDNPFPARHYSESAWNQLLMKAAFMSLPLERMWGARERDNAELSRMAQHYIEQQESAGRTFPPQLLAAMAAYPPPSALAKLLGYSSHAVVELRLGAAEALARTGQARAAPFLRERLEVERDPRVQAALQRALAATQA
jgi:hypothetical protein